MPTRSRDSILLLATAAIVASLIYLVAWTQARVDDQALALSPEAERLREELVKLSTDLDATSLEGRACRADIAGFLYALRKDSVARRLAFQAEAAWQANSRALVLTALIAAAAGLVLGGIHLSRSAPAGNPRPSVRAGGAAVAILAVALGAMAVALIVDRRGNAAPAPGALALDLAGFVERCEDYRQSDD